MHASLSEFSFQIQDKQNTPYISLIVTIAVAAKNEEETAAKIEEAAAKKAALIQDGAVLRCVVWKPLV